MSVLDDFPRISASIETYMGSAGTGATFAPAVTRAVVIEDSRKNVRSSTGEVTISETTIFDDPAYADLYAGGSKITVNGRQSLVIITKRRIVGDADVDHVEVALT